MGVLFSRFDFGTHEAEYQNVKELDLGNKLYQCNKDHEGYIFSQELTIDDLPKGFEKNKLLSLITLLCDLTVKIRTRYISSQRKWTFWHNMRFGYPLSSLAGKTGSVTGSGRIWDVFEKRERDEFANITCRCPNCKTDPDPNRDVWIIKVYTATHVVFDTTEALETECVLFYDSEKASTKTIYGLETIWTHKLGDLCILFCVTCDGEIKDKLIKTKNELKILWEDCQKDYKDIMDEERLAIIVSHPHGCPKQVSIGTWNERKYMPLSREHMFTYNISTCSGSSGAPVFILGSNYMFSAYCHSGTNTSVNYSTRWLNKSNKD